MKKEEQSTTGLSNTNGNMGDSDVLDQPHKCVREAQVNSERSKVRMRMWKISHLSGRTKASLGVRC